MKRIGVALAAGVAVLSLAACGGDSPAPEDTMNNPASAYCEEKGGTVNLDTGICTLPDGTEIDEWELYRSDHPESG